MIQYHILLFKSYHDTLLFDIFDIVSYNTLQNHINNIISKDKILYYIKCYDIVSKYKIKKDTISYHIIQYHIIKIK